MIDRHFRPSLIEVNQSPSFATDSPLDYQVKKSVLTDTFKLLHIDQAAREQVIADRNEANAERIMTGKVNKIGAEERERLRQKLHEEREDYEASVIGCGSGYELIYPYYKDDDKQAEYEMLLERSNRIWDDFTTGKSKRPPPPNQDSNAKLPKKKKTEPVDDDYDPFRQCDPSSSEGGEEKELEMEEGKIDEEELKESEMAPTDAENDGVLQLKL
jgi:hypothetical protein